MNLLLVPVQPVSFTNSFTRISMNIMYTHAPVRDRIAARACVERVTLLWSSQSSQSNKTQCCALHVSVQNWMNEWMSEKILKCSYVCTHNKEVFGLIHQSCFHSSETMPPTANRRPNRDMWVTTGGAPDSAACSGEKIINKYIKKKKNLQRIYISQHAILQQRLLTQYGLSWGQAAQTSFPVW